ncbi:PREDICTED: capZ-interacting protein [Lipotes vexillifer]|uniref:CapZ-interacting protein n=1 Tax=Lipotes vexillifer TaxID=118797 RepID=A0A340XG56_LIPVE|nr:PREDICTED: capZ-interacting protein [Lipotes vexillifer]
MHCKRRARAARAVPQPASRARSRPLALCPPQPSPAPAGAERRAGIASPGQSKRARPPPSQHLEDMEERPAETNASVDDSAPPSVAQLAGRFREQAAAAKETPASKPTRRKPPCSLSLFPPRVELGQNGEEKSPPSASHPPKVKVKSSPLIEKLQANLVFDPAALLPGASPKSPGLKAMVSPFHSPPSTPNSPGVWSRASEPEEVPVSFDQPPEGSHLPSYNKVRTRGSIKRRPPSRRFRRSQSEDCADLGGLRAEESSQENGAKEENGDEVFLAKSKTPGSPPLRRTPSWTEKQEEKGRALRVAQQHEKAVGSSEEAASQRPARASSPEAEDGGGSPTEEKPAEGQMEEPTEVKERAASKEEEPRQSSRDTEGLEEGAVGEETPQNPPGGGEGDHSSEQGAGQEKQDDGTILEPGCDPGTGHAQPDTSSEVPKTEDNTPVQDTKM